MRIKRRSQGEWLTLYVFMMPFAFFVLMDLLHFPALVKYTIDAAWLTLLAIMLLSRVRVENPQLRGMLGLVTAYFVLTLIGFALGGQSPLYYLWGFRNNARFYVFFFACAFFLNRDSADMCLRTMDKLFWINFIVTLFQFFVMGKKQDYLGGIFGVEKGVNGYTNIFLMIVAAWHVLRYMNGEENLRDCLIKCLVALIVAALAELKIYFVEFVLIIGLASLMTQFSVKKIWIVIGAGTGLIVAAQVLQALFPGFADWFRLSRMWETLTSSSGYTNRGDMNRFTAVFIAWNGFLDTWLEKLIGLGLGNCDYASGYAFLTTPFYRAYKGLNYVWFSSAMLILETGLIGLLLYGAFFVKAYRAAAVAERAGAGNETHCRLARIIALMGLLLIIYNGSLRMESGFMIYFTLALPFVKDAKRRQIHGEGGTSA